MIYIVECALTLKQTDDDWNRWYHSMKPPHILPTAVPGISTTQRFKGINVRPPAYFAMYSVASADVMASDAYRNAGGGRFQTENWKPIITFWNRDLFGGADAPDVPMDSILTGPARARRLAARHRLPVAARGRTRPLDAVPRTGGARPRRGGAAPDRLDAWPARLPPGDTAGHARAAAARALPGRLETATTFSRSDMTNTVRGWTGVLVAALLAPASLPDANAQSGYPSRPVRIISPSSPPGGSDTAARIIAPALSERLGQPVVVENRAGAGTMLGHDYAAKSPPDGYTLVMAINTLAIIPVTFKSVPYDALRDFAPISQVLSQPGMMIAHPSLPARTVKELIALAKARPGEVLYATGGNGSNPHMAMALFLYMTGTRMLHVPFRGGGGMAIGIMSGQGSVGVLSILASIPHVRSGRVRALGVTGATRSAITPEVPAIAETVKGYEALQWYGLMVPAGTPREIIARLHKETIALLANPQVRARLTQDGADVVGNSPEEFSAALRAEIEKWARVARAAGIQPE